VKTEQKMGKTEQKPNKIFFSGRNKYNENPGKPNKKKEALKIVILVNEVKILYKFNIQYDNMMIY
jgi:hypothetical protein